MGAWALCAPRAYAQELTQIDALSFGRLAVRNNAGPRAITVDPNNNVVSSPFIISDIEPTRGEYLLENQDPNELLDIDISNGNLTLNDTGVGNFMTVDSFTNNNPTTDAGGNATIYIGATLTTSGNGSGYTSGSFEDNNMTMIINYQ